MGKGGRPPRQWRWLTHDVDRVIAQRAWRGDSCSVPEACAFLAAGGFVEALPVYDTATATIRTAKVVWGRWDGMKVKTLVRKYRREKALRK